jgi:hypothetical protein
MSVSPIAYLRAAQAYMLISMPTGTSTIFGVFQAILALLQKRDELHPSLQASAERKVRQRNLYGQSRRALLRRKLGAGTAEGFRQTKTGSMTSPFFCNGPMPIPAVKSPESPE